MLQCSLNLAWYILFVLCHSVQILRTSVNVYISVAKSLLGFSSCACHGFQSSHVGCLCRALEMIHWYRSTFFELNNGALFMYFGADYSE